MLGKEKAKQQLENEVIGWGAFVRLIDIGGAVIAAYTTKEAAEYFSNEELRLRKLVIKRYENGEVELRYLYPESGLSTTTTLRVREDGNTYGKYERISWVVTTEPNEDGSEKTFFLDLDTGERIDAEQLAQHPINKASDSAQVYQLKDGSALFHIPVVSEDGSTLRHVVVTQEGKRFESSSVTLAVSDRFIIYLEHDRSDASIDTFTVVDTKSEERWQVKFPEQYNNTIWYEGISVRDGRLFVNFNSMSESQTKVETYVAQLRSSQHNTALELKLLEYPENVDQMAAIPGYANDLFVGFRFGADISDDQYSLFTFNAETEQFELLQHLPKEYPVQGIWAVNEDELWITVRELPTATKQQDYLFNLESGARLELHEQKLGSNESVIGFKTDALNNAPPYAGLLLSAAWILQMIARAVPPKSSKQK